MNINHMIHKKEFYPLQPRNQWLDVLNDYILIVVIGFYFKSYVEKVVVIY